MAWPVTAAVVPTGPAAGRPVTLPPCRRSPASPVRPAVTTPPPPAGDGPPGAADAVAAARRARLPERPAAAPDRAHTTLHDEWDCHLQAHRRHWTAVHERRLTGTDLRFLDDLRARFPTLVRQLRRRAVRLQADLPRRARRLADGDTVDLDAALEALVAPAHPAAVGQGRHTAGWRRRRAPGGRRPAVRGTPAAGPFAGRRPAAGHQQQHRLPHPGTGPAPTCPNR